MTWSRLDDGATIGTRGSEQGQIVQDEEHELGARITLEEQTVSAPFAITCGIYGWIVHTRFFADLSEARSELERMKVAIVVILNSIPWATDPEVEKKHQDVVNSITQFVAEFP